MRSIVTEERTARGYRASHVAFAKYRPPPPSPTPPPNSPMLYLRTKNRRLPHLPLVVLVYKVRMTHPNGLINSCLYLLDLTWMTACVFTC